MKTSSRPTIYTASWSTRLPVGATAIGISRGVPRGRSGFRRLREFEPGPWFHSVDPQTYLHRYIEILDRLDPAAIRDRLLDFGCTPVFSAMNTPTTSRPGRSGVTGTWRR